MFHNACKYLFRGFKFNFDVNNLPCFKTPRKFELDNLEALWKNFKSKYNLQNNLNLSNSFMNLSHFMRLHHRLCMCIFLWNAKKILYEKLLLTMKSGLCMIIQDVEFLDSKQSSTSVAKPYVHSKKIFCVFHGIQKVKLIT